MMGAGLSFYGSFLLRGCSSRLYLSRFVWGCWCCFVAFFGVCVCFVGFFFFFKQRILL